MSENSKGSEGPSLTVSSVRMAGLSIPIEVSEPSGSSVTAVVASSSLPINAVPSTGQRGEP